MNKIIEKVYNTTFRTVQELSNGGINKTGIYRQESILHRIKLSEKQNDEETDNDGNKE